jgi:hypothetical protein
VRNLRPRTGSDQELLRGELEFVGFRLEEIEAGGDGTGKGSRTPTAGKQRKRRRR